MKREDLTFFCLFVLFITKVVFFANKIEKLSGRCCAWEMGSSWKTLVGGGIWSQSGSWCNPGFMVCTAWTIFIQQISAKLVQRHFCVEQNFCQCQPQTSNILASPRLLCICITYLFILLHTLHTFWLISVVLWIYLSYTITLSSSLPTRCRVQAVPLSCLLSICSVISSWTK